LGAARRPTDAPQCGISISLYREEVTDLLPEIETPTLLITGSYHS